MLNSKNEIFEIIDSIKPLNQEAMEEAALRQRNLAKVPGSLGGLEDISIRLAGITGKAMGNSVKNQGIVIFSGDNGVVEEGVASAPQTVTLMQTINFTKGITGVASQAEYFGIDILAVDVGVKLPIPEEYLTSNMLEDGRLSKKIINRRIGRGTKNLMKEPGLARSIFGNGFSTIISGFFGSTPNTTYGENIGVLAITKVFSTWVIGGAAVFAIILSFLGKLSALIQSIPTAVMGGISLLLFGVIAVSGIRILVEKKVNYKL